MVKFATSLIVASAFAATVLAQASADIDYEIRDIAEDYELSARDLELLDLIERELGEEFLEREFFDDEELSARDAEELDARDPNRFKNFFKNAFKKVKNILFRREQESGEDLAARDFHDEFDAREFEDSELEARDLDLDELDARELELDIEDLIQRALFERDLEFESEMFERDFEVDELD